MNSDVLNKVTEAMKNMNVVGEIEQCKTKKELYAIITPYLGDVSEEEFYMALVEMKEQDGEISLSDDELEDVAGGKLKIRLKFEVEISNE